MLKSLIPVYKALVHHAIVVEDDKGHATELSHLAGGRLGPDGPQICAACRPGCQSG